MALILGGEGGNGVSRLLIDKSDYVVSIPTLGNINSLNVSVAGGVLLYEMLRQRAETMEHLIIDGYNVIGNWPELKRLSAASLEDARENWSKYSPSTRPLPVNK